MLKSLIIPRVNPDEELCIDGTIIKPGQSTLLRINAGKLPSDNRINVHAHVFHTGKAGPSLLVLGGVHGNEINGIEIVRRSIEQGFYNQITCGTVIVIPLLNVYGFINFSRDVADGKDVNRSFPGHINGSLASRVARILTKKILPHVDIALDFHTGGDARYNYPHVRYFKGDPVASETAKQFGVKLLMEQALIPNSFRRAAYDMGVPAVVYEGGESIRLDKLSIDLGMAGITNVMQGLGLVDQSVVTETQERVVIKKNNWVRAVSAGLFIWSRSSGDLVNKGDKLGEIKDPFGSKSVDVLSTYSGYIICHNNASVVSLGDALFHIGNEFELLSNNSSYQGNVTF